MLLANTAVAQSVYVQAGARVDTSDAETREVFEHWQSYLSSRPDSTYNNPHWSDADKRRYPHFDLSGTLIYHGVTTEYAMWKPHVNSIEKVRDHYEIRTAYLSTDTTYPEQHLWALQRVGVRKEDGKWKLFNLINEITAGYRRERIGNISFIQHPSQPFYRASAERTVALADSLRRAFDLKPIDSIEFYIAWSPHEMMDIVGVNASLGASTGYAVGKNAQLFTSYGSPWYPHELVHVLLREFDETIPSIISEGIATLIGGGSNRTPTYFETLQEAKKEFVDPKVTLDHVIQNRWVNGGTNIFYASGAWLCEEIIRSGGAEALKRVMRAGKGDAALKWAVERELKLKWEKIEERYLKAMSM
jgi:hypothetical protein